MATSLIQKVDTSSAAAASLVPTLANLPQNGNSLIVMTGGNVGVSTITGGGVPASGPGSWAVVSFSGSHSPTEVWLGLVTGTPAAAVTVTFTGSGAVNAKLEEWSGLLTKDQVSATPGGPSTTITTGTITPTSGGQLIIATGSIDTAISAGPTGGFSQEGTLTAGAQRVGVGSLLQGAPAAINTTWTVGSDGWDSVIASFISASVGAYLPTRIPNNRVGPMALRHASRSPFIPSANIPLPPAFDPSQFPWQFESADEQMAE